MKLFSNIKSSICNKISYLNALVLVNIIKTTKVNKLFNKNNTKGPNLPTFTAKTLILTIIIARINKIKALFCKNNQLIRGFFMVSSRKSIKVVGFQRKVLRNIIASKIFNRFNKKYLLGTNIHRGMKILIKMKIILLKNLFNMLLVNESFLMLFLIYFFFLLYGHNIY